MNIPHNTWWNTPTNTSWIGKFSQKFNNIKKWVIASALSIIMLWTSLAHANRWPNQWEQPVNDWNNTLSLNWKENDTMFYTVQKDDVLSKIAEKFQIPLKELLEMNPRFLWREDIILPDEKVKIRENLIWEWKHIVTTSDQDGLFAIAERYNMTHKEIIALNPQIANINKIEIWDIIHIKENKVTLPSKKIAKARHTPIQETQIQTDENKTHKAKKEKKLVEKKSAWKNRYLIMARIISDKIDQGKRKMIIKSNLSSGNEEWDDAIKTTIDIINTITPEGIVLVKVMNWSYRSMAYDKEGTKNFNIYNKNWNKTIPITKWTKLEFFTQEDLDKRSLLIKFLGLSPDDIFRNHTKKEKWYYKFNFPTKQILYAARLHTSVPSDAMALHIKWKGWVQRENENDQFRYVNTSKRHLKVIVNNNTEVKIASDAESRKIELVNLSPVERYKAMTPKERVDTYIKASSDGTKSFQFKSKEIETLARLNDFMIENQQYLTLKFQDEMELVRINKTTGKLEYENEFIAKRPLIFNKTKIEFITDKEYLSALQKRERSYQIARMDEEYIKHHHKSMNGFWSCGAEHRDIQMWLNKNHKIPTWGMHWYKYEEYYEQWVKDWYFIKVYVWIPRNAKWGASLVYAQTNIIDSQEGNKEECGVVNKVMSKRTDRQKCGHVEKKVAGKYIHAIKSQSVPGGSVNGNTPESGFIKYAFYPTEKYLALALAGNDSGYAKVMNNTSSVIVMTKAWVKAINGMEPWEISPTLLASTYADTIEDPLLSNAFHKLLSSTKSLKVITLLGTINWNSQNPIKALKKYWLENRTLALQAKNLEEKNEYQKIARIYRKIIKQLEYNYTQEKATHTLAQVSV